jgi:hypothetical protein
MLSAQECTSHHNQSTSPQPQNSSELFKFDTTIVFGEGPVRPILLPHEVASDQAVAWENYKRDPQRFKEPNFWIMQQPRYLAQLTKIDLMNITDEEKAVLREAKIMEWQKTGWFGLKQWGRQNALAAGCALYTGLTEKIVLSGGRTKSKWTRENIPQSRLDAWPSEAELMADIIERYYGKLYEKRYQRPIREVITIEDRATNTLENFAYTINKHPELLAENKRVGFLTAKHHLKRVSLLAQIFSIRHADESKLCAQDILCKQEVVSQIDTEEDILEEVRMFQKSQRIKELEQTEAQLIRGLLEPQYLTYWFGYLGDVKNPTVLREAMRRLNEPQWSEVARGVFQQLGLNMHEYTKNDICELASRDPNKYYLLVEGLKKLKRPEYRKVPQLQI